MGSGQARPGCLPWSLQDKLGWPMSPPAPIHTPWPHTDHPCMSPPAPIALPWETVTPSSLRTGSFQSQPRTMDPSEKHDKHVLPVSSLSQLSPSSFPLVAGLLPLAPPNLSSLHLCLSLFTSATISPFSPHSSMLPVPQPPLIQPWNRPLDLGLSIHRTLMPAPEPGRHPGTSGEGVNRMASPPPSPAFN